MMQVDRLRAGDVQVHSNSYLRPDCIHALENICVQWRSDGFETSSGHLIYQFEFELALFCQNTSSGCEAKLQSWSSRSHE